MQEWPTSITIGDITVPQVDVHMVCSSIKEAANSALWHVDTPLSLPPNYQIRSYRDGDEAVWTQIMRLAEQFFAIETTLFENQFGSHIDQLLDRMFFVDFTSEDGTVYTVGTATAWWKDSWLVPNEASGKQDDRGEWAQVHWVAVVPAHQGVGLAKPLMGHVMRRMVQSHNRAMLGTSTARVWALKVYLDFGFLPDDDELKLPNVKNAWHQVQKILKHPALEAVLGQG